MNENNGGHNDSDERIYLEGLSYIFETYLIYPALIGFIIILLLALAGCVLRDINGM
jgi:hypothetical protein